MHDTTTHPTVVAVKIVMVTLLTWNISSIVWTSVMRWSNNC